MRKAIEAQGRVDPDAIAAAAEDAIPADEEVWEAQQASIAVASREEAPQVEQPSLLDGEPVVIRYESFVAADDVRTYRRVKAVTMGLADEARKVIAGMVEGSIGDGTRSSKQFVQTARGSYRIGASADNTTATAAHDRMGVQAVKLDDPADLLAFFDEHGLDARAAYDQLVRRLQAYARAHT